MTNRTSNRCRPIEYETKKSKMAIDEWRVEAVNYPELGLGGDGEIYVAIFSGPNAEGRVREMPYGNEIRQLIGYFNIYDIDAGLVA